MDESQLTEVESLKLANLRSSRALANATIQSASLMLQRIDLEEKMIGDEAAARSTAIAALPPGTYLFGHTPTVPVKGPVTVVWNPASPVVSQSTGTFGLGADDWILFDSIGTPHVTSPVQTREQIIADPALGVGQKREKLEAHGYAPME